MGINLSEIIQSMVNPDSGGVLNTYKAHKYGRLLEAHMDKDPRYKEILGDPNISAEDKQRVLNAAVNTFLTSRGYAGPPLEVLIGEESLLARGKVVISKDKLNGLSFLEDLGHELGHLVSYDDGNEDTAKIVEGKMGTLEETDTQGKYNEYLESLKEEYKNLKTEEETKEWLATVSESEIEYINGKRVLAGGAAVLISGGRIYVGVTTASAGVVLLNTPFFVAGGVLTLGGSGETIFGLSDFSVGVQDIYYGLIESEKESYNFLESNLDKVLGKESYSILNYVSGNSTAYTSQVKSTYYDSNPSLAYIKLGKGSFLIKGKDNKVEFVKPSNKKGSLMVQVDWKGKEEELNAAKRLAKAGQNVILRNPEGKRSPDGKTSDIILNGVNYDVYTPITSNIDNIVGAVAKKNSQGKGVILDLSKTSVKIEELTNIQQRIEGSIKKGGSKVNIKEIIILPKE